MVPSVGAWELLSGMGSGAEHGLEVARIKTLRQALSACDAITAFYTDAKRYDIDDLVCFACMSQHRELSGPDMPGTSLTASVFTYPPTDELPLELSVQLEEPDDVPSQDDIASTYQLLRA